jgi:hypothetical protein
MGEPRPERDDEAATRDEERREPLLDRDADDVGDDHRSLAA